MHLGDEPRLNPKILNAIKAVGLDKFSAEGITLTTSSAMEDLAEFIVAFESGAARCEAGSANLALATALKAKKDGWISEIDGVFGFVPYIS
ncbi:hypothetical protein B0A50_02428 [Salinomyces thailandicus]|uniref:Uncharacterized protein n=1 Tax=Salinomyces thailandicus TaxID=706561 RepID=A0A4U0U6M2_9PEZI|nr:hypothetical protein B0A50_02428 [Salinomyces thailandica]